MYNWGAVKL